MIRFNFKIRGFSCSFGFTSLMFALFSTKSLFGSCSTGSYSLISSPCFGAVSFIRCMSSAILVSFLLLLWAAVGLINGGASITTHRVFCDGLNLEDCWYLLSSANYCFGIWWTCLIKFSAFATDYMGFTSVDYCCCACVEFVLCYRLSICRPRRISEVSLGFRFRFGSKSGSSVHWIGP